MKQVHKYWAADLRTADGHIYKNIALRSFNKNMLKEHKGQVMWAVYYDYDNCCTCVFFEPDYNDTAYYDLGYLKVDTIEEVKVYEERKKLNYDSYSYKITDKDMLGILDNLDFKDISTVKQ